jgi:hypothetical protein
MCSDMKFKFEKEVEGRGFVHLELEVHLNDI